MFIANNSNSEILKAFAILFSEAIKNLESHTDVIIKFNAKIRKRISIS